MKKVYKYIITDHEKVCFDLTTSLILVDGTPPTNILTYPDNNELGKSKDVTFNLPKSGKCKNQDAYKHSFLNNYCRMEMEYNSGNQNYEFRLTEMDDDGMASLKYEGTTTHQLGSGSFIMRITNAKYSIVAGSVTEPEGVNLFSIGTSDDRIQRNTAYDHVDYIIEYTFGPVLKAFVASGKLHHETYFKAKQ